MPIQISRASTLPSIALALCLLAGCNSDNGPSEPGADTVDFAKDDAAIELVHSKPDSLAGQPPAAIAQAALAYIQSLPDFKASGITDEGVVWAQFQDGVLYSIATD